MQPRSRVVRSQREAGPGFFHARAIEEREKPKAKERQEASRPKPGEQAHKVNVPRPEKFSAREERAADVAAKAVDLSRPTYQKAKEIVDAAQKDPEKFGDLPKQMDETGKTTRQDRFRRPIPGRVGV